MTTPYASGTVAGVALTGPGSEPIMAIIGGGENLKGSRAVRAKSSADGTVYAKSFPLNHKSGRFTLTLKFCPKSVFDAIVAAVESDLATSQPSTITLSDFVNDFSVLAFPDEANGNRWFSYKPDRTNATAIPDAVFRFISTGDAEEE